MPEDLPAHPAPRARPVAGLPLEALIEGAQELARGWAIALLLARPLDGIGEIPFEEIARRGPSLCGQLLRSLCSEAELALLCGAEQAPARCGAPLARELAALAGAHDAAATIAATEALRGVIWEALRDRISSDVSPDPSRARTLADASDRLAHICAAMLTQAIAGLASSDGHASSEASSEDPGARASKVPAASGPAGGASAAIVIVDERHRQEALRQGGPRVSAPPHEPTVAAEAIRPGEIEIRDEREEEGPAAWIGSIGRQLERFEQDRLSFAVLLVEFSDAPSAGPLTETLEGVLRRALSDSGGSSLTRERDGRYWLLAPRTDRSGANDLAERLTLGITAAGAAQGAEVLVAVGTAVCPQDGTQTSALAAHADIGLYAARSRMRSIDVAAAPVDRRA